jgi:hypothetical protein
MSEHRERRLDQQVRNTIGKLLQECFRADIAEELPARLVGVLKKLDERLKLHLPANRPASRATRKRNSYWPISLSILTAPVPAPNIAFIAQSHWANRSEKIRTIEK